MDVKHIDTYQCSTGKGCTDEKQQWIEDNARRLQHLFEKWQKPLGINNNQCRKYLTDQLNDYSENSLLRSLIDSITRS